MDTVISSELVDILIAEGSIPILHRFLPLEEQEKWVKKYKDKTFISCGIQKIDETRSSWILEPSAPASTWLMDTLIGCSSISKS